MHNIIAIRLPTSALLSRYVKEGFYTDCFTTELPISVTHEQFVLAFYSTWLFKIERFILKYAVSKPSTDKQALALASGQLDLFSAWTVEDRCSNQILLCDFQKKTRSWLMTADVEGASVPSTTLFFGSAVVPEENKRTGELEISVGFKLLLGFHKLYSIALLSCAAAKLIRVNR